MKLNHPITQSVYAALSQAYNHQPIYLQSVLQFLESLDPYMDWYPHFSHDSLKSLLIPERIIEFKVTYEDDQQLMHEHRGYRIQHSNHLGPYKGGLRFNPSVSEDSLKFLAFSQTIKNALSTMDLGGAKGGSDFDPKGKSLDEIKRFSQAFIKALARDISPTYDVPAGDIGVSQREIGIMVKTLRMISDNMDGALTGKPLDLGGSNLRTEATGYGLVYFMESLLKHFYDTDFKDKKVLISGAGNVAIYAAQKVFEKGGLVIGMSDSSGYVINEAGLNLEHIKTIKLQERGSLAKLVEFDSNTVFKAGHGLFETPCDIALACATQNEVTLDDVKALEKHGLLALGEGANMPLTKAARDYVIEHGILDGVDIAANAGGVIVSGFEMIQNAKGESWSREQVDELLQAKMQTIFEKVILEAEQIRQPRNLVVAATLAGLNRLLKAQD